MAKLEWLGHAAWRIELDGKVLIVDPFLTGNPAASIKPDEIPNADLILVSHDHRDHTGDAFEIAKRTDATLLAMYELAVKASEAGVKKTMGVNIGSVVEVDGLRIAITPAIHSGNPCGFVIMGDEASIYHAGDTALFGDMKLLGQLYRPHIALLPIGGFYTMGPTEAAVAVSLIKPKVAIPMHYNTFDAIKQNPEDFAKLARRKARGVKIVVIKPGESYSYSAKRK